MSDANQETASEAKSQTVAVHLGNVFPFIVEMLAKLNRDVDRLQKTIDAVGLAVVAGQEPKEKAADGGQ